MILLARSKYCAKIKLSRGKKVVSVKFVVEDDGGVQQTLQDVVDKMVEGESGGGGGEAQKNRFCQLPA